MTKAIRIHETGGPEVLTFEDVDVPQPGPGEALVRQTAVGVNYLDIYHRAGTFHVPLELPAIPGVEGAGAIEAVGAGVSDLAPGDRVAYPFSVGGYAETRIVAAADLVKLPDNIRDDVAAAIMLKGLTVYHLLHNVTRITAGDTILFHAAAGGVGLLACQWAKHLGATVIGTVGSAEKAAIARANGCDHAINYREEDFVNRVNGITRGVGAKAVFDSVAKDTFLGSLKCVAPFGTVVTFGEASGPLPAVSFGEMPTAYVTRGTVGDVTAEAATLRQASEKLFTVVADGHVTPNIAHTYYLKDAAKAHRDMEARRTTGSIVLKP